jgi:hypothetical protein
MNYQHKIKPLLTTLSMCCAAPLSAADPEPSVEPVVWHVENAEPRGGQGGGEGCAAADSAAGVYRRSESARNHGWPGPPDNRHGNGERLVEYHSRLSFRSGVAQTGINAQTDGNTDQEVL